jgi:hypothetical protein
MSMSYDTVATSHPWSSVVSADHPTKILVVAPVVKPATFSSYPVGPGVFLGRISLSRMTAVLRQRYATNDQHPSLYESPMLRSKS